MCIFARTYAYVDSFVFKLIFKLHAHHISRSRLAAVSCVAILQATLHSCHFEFKAFMKQALKANRLKQRKRKRAADDDEQGVGPAQPAKKVAVRLFVCQFACGVITGIVVLFLYSQLL